MIAPPAAHTAVQTVIGHATSDEIPSIVDFTEAARISMFPMLDATSHSEHANRELATFQQTYLEHTDGAFLTARVNGVLVATIGYVPYDYRFPQLHFENGRVVEVVRLYVDPAFRRTGLASRLFTALEKTARQRDITQLYLHTHPFLPGAVAFWEKHEFAVIHADEDPLWRTIHMRVHIERKKYLYTADVHPVI